MTEIVKLTLPKSERLCSEKAIGELFKKGNKVSLSEFTFPLKVVFQVNESGMQALFSVSKRSFKKAVDRNLIRRRIKEAYRLNKAILADSTPKSIAFIYIHKEIAEFKQIQKAMISILKRMASQ